MQKLHRKWSEQGRFIVLYKCIRRMEEEVDQKLKNVAMLQAVKAETGLCFLLVGWRSVHGAGFRISRRFRGADFFVHSRWVVFLCSGMTERGLCEMLEPMSSLAR